MFTVSTQFYNLHYITNKIQADWYLIQVNILFLYGKTNKAKPCQQSIWGRIPSRAFSASLPFAKASLH